MIVLGCVLLILALLIPALQVLFTIGCILVVVGVVLLLVRPGGRHWY